MPSQPTSLKLVFSIPLHLQGADKSGSVLWPLASLVVRDMVIAFPTVRNHHINVTPDGPLPEIDISCDAPAKLENDVIRFGHIMWSQHWILHDPPPSRTDWSDDTAILKAQIRTFVAGESRSKLHRTVVLRLGQRNAGPCAG